MMRSQALNTRSTRIGSMRMVIVDDEQIARRQLIRHLKAYRDIQVVGQAEGGLQAIEVINNTRPDLVFLDVEMPDISGFDLLPYLKVKPIIVFCSGYDRYALKAFETAATDYILKPVQPQRLAKTLDRVQQRLNQEHQETETLSPIKYLKKITCHENSKYHVLWIEEIVLFQKEGRYTQACLSTGEKKLNELSLDYLEQHLPEERFFRINRQTMIRKSWVKSVHSGVSGTGGLETVDGTCLSISRNRWKMFKPWFLS